MQLRYLSGSYRNLLHSSILGWHFLAWWMDYKKILWGCPFTFFTILSLSNTLFKALSIVQRSLTYEIILRNYVIQSIFFMKRTWCHKASVNMEQFSLPPDHICHGAFGKHKENPANQFRIQESLHERLLYGITALHPFSDIVDSASVIHILMSFVLVNDHNKLIYHSLTGHTAHQLVCSQRQYQCLKYYGKDGNVHNSNLSKWDVFFHYWNILCDSIISPHNPGSSEITLDSVPLRFVGSFVTRQL